MCPLISIVTVNYNDRAGLLRTLHSIFCQNYTDYESVVIDGGSSDGSKDLLISYDDKITYWVSEKDNGIYNAMNKGLNHCSGEWVFFLNSGDVFYNENVLSSVNFSVSDNKIGAIYCRYQYYTRYNELLINEVDHPFTESTKKYRSMGFSHQSVFVKTDLAKKIGFDESFKLCADYNMMMKIHLKGYHFVRDNTIITTCDGRGGFSYNNRHLQDSEIARVCGCENKLYVRFVLYVKNIIRPIYRYLNKIIAK
jgi:glycosyltransferase involved in cell wall biosynthesis